MIMGEIIWTTTSSKNKERISDTLVSTGNHSGSSNLTRPSRLSPMSEIRSLFLLPYCTSTVSRWDYMSFVSDGSFTQDGTITDFLLTLGFVVSKLEVVSLFFDSLRLPGPQAMVLPVTPDMNAFAY
jgi:hypothetical protein